MIAKFCWSCVIERENQSTIMCIHSMLYQLLTNIVFILQMLIDVNQIRHFNYTYIKTYSLSSSATVHLYWAVENKQMSANCRTVVQKIKHAYNIHNNNAIYMQCAKYTLKTSLCQVKHTHVFASNYKIVTHYLSYTMFIKIINIREEQ